MRRPSCRAQFKPYEARLYTHSSLLIVHQPDNGVCEEQNTGDEVRVGVREMHLVGLPFAGALVPPSLPGVSDEAVHLSSLQGLVG